MRGIQKAFEQANRLRQRILKEENIILYDRDGNISTTIKGKSVKNAYCICVTADNFGPIATDLSPLLEKQPDDPFPWAVNIFDLEAFLNALHKKNWGVDQLGEFLEQRSLLHGKAFTGDELEIAGPFVLEGSLNGLLSQNESRIFLSPDLAQVFDDIYIEDQGGPKAQLTRPSGLHFSQLGPVPSNFSRRDAENHVSKIALGQALDAILPQSRKKIGRNDPCPCGSGRKYKHCCL